MPYVEKAYEFFVEHSNLICTLVIALGAVGGAAYRTHLRKQGQPEPGKVMLPILIWYAISIPALAGFYLFGMRWSAAARYNAGVIASRQGKLADAIAEYKTAIGMKPDFAAAHYNLGNELAQTGRLDEAIAEYREAVRLEPDADSHFNLALALHKENRVEEAMSEYRKAITMKPGYAGAHYNLGVLLTQMGHGEEADKEFEEAHRLDPNLPLSTTR